MNKICRSWALIAGVALLSSPWLMGTTETPAQPAPTTAVAVAERPVSILEIRAVIIDPEDLKCLAQNIYHEARGEGERGMRAVAHVTVNRVDHDRFPDTVCGVVRQAKYSEWWRAQGKLVPLRNRCQFSWYCDGRSDQITNQKAWRKSLRIAEEVLAGHSEDLTQGATHYYNPHKANPGWSQVYARTAQVENHTFLRM